MRFPRWRHPALRVVALVAAAAVGCAPTFKLSRYSTNSALYAAAVREFQQHHWENAIQAFDKLTLELPPRDTLLPRAHYFLAQAHERQGEHLLAAQSFTRLYESFPDDSLADDALFEAGQAYQRMWRKPELDAQFGQSAMIEYQTLLSAYPDSKLAPRAAEEMRRLQEWFATKDYENGLHYFRRKAYDSAIIYFKDVVKQYGSSARARDAYLRLAEAYRAIRYREDLAETCATLRQRYPSDGEVREACTAVPTAVARDTTARDTTARDTTARDTTAREPRA